MAKTYNFKRVIVTVFGVPLQGFIDGDAVSIETTQDDWEMTVGVDGEGTRSAMNDDSGSITVRLQASSLSNDYLNGLRQADKLSGLGQFPVSVQDTLGATLAFAEQAWIRRVPNQDFGRSVGEREWVFDTTKLSLNIGGNPV